MSGRRGKQQKKRRRGPVRVNVGGPDYRDAEGDLWRADVAYHRGGWGCLNMPETDVLATADQIQGTDDPALFQTVRLGEQMRYRFDLPDGAYRVRLLFAEIYWESSDAEEQDVYVQGKRVLRGFNIFDEAGHDTAVTKEFETWVTDGSLEVRFVGRSLPMHSGARVCGIEVVPLPAT